MYFQNARSPTENGLDNKYQAPASGEISLMSLTPQLTHLSVTDFSLRDSSTINPPQQGHLVSELKKKAKFFSNHK